jgi:micrococcal nuclease
LTILADHLRAPGGPADGDWARFDRGSFVVSRVVDGDTIHVVPVGMTAPTTKIRLIGIDAPETGMHFAEQATAYLITRTSARALTLRLEPTETRDRYDRLLAYVYVSDSDCLNLDMVRDGFAYADRRHRHTLRGQFEAAENEARKKSRGLWREITDADMPAWRQEWLRNRSTARTK